MMQSSTLSQPQQLAQAPIPHADIERKQKMREAYKAYHGEFPSPLIVVDGQPKDTTTVSYCEPIVTKGASFLFGPVLKLEATDEHSPTSPVQKMIDGLWGDDDDRMSLLSDAAINGGVCGEVFLKLIPAQKQMKYPRIVVMDPQIVRIVTAPDDCSLILAYIVEYTAYDWQKRQIIARIDPDGLAGVAGEYALDDSWTITNYVRKGTNTTQNAWVQVGTPDQWPYPFAPIFSCKNLPNPNEPWGAPDLTPDLIDQNKALNFLISNLMRIVKYHGHPVTWAKGMRADQISRGIDDMIVFNSPDAQMGTLSPMENFAGILSVIANIMSNIDQQSRVPAVALGRQEALPRGNLSGVALALMFQPLIEKTTQKRRLYGKLIREITRAALVIAGEINIEDFEDYQIDLHWQPLLPADNLAAAQEAILLQQIGVSQATILAGLGMDADDEIDRKTEEDAQKVTAFSRGQGLPPTVPPAPVPGAQVAPQQPVAVPA